MTSPPSGSSDPPRLHLDRIVAEVLNGATDDVYLMLPFIAWKLKQFRLDHQYDPCDIFLDAYNRAVKAIDKGEQIHNIPGWLKSTAFNIIREYSRKAQQIKTESMEHQQFADLSEPCITDEILEMRLAWLLTALSELKMTDREILHLRMQGLSYEEIAQQRGGTAAALRQKVSRLLKQLRHSASQVEQ